MALLLAFLPMLHLDGQVVEKKPIDPGSVPIEHYNFSKTDKDASIWSAMYIASNNKIYIGLCTHGDAATVYEFDIESRSMRQLANLTVLLDESGRI